MNHISYVNMKRAIYKAIKWYGREQNLDKGVLDRVPIEVGLAIQLAASGLEVLERLMKMIDGFELKSLTSIEEEWRKSQ